MLLFIDAYNVLKQVMGNILISSAARRSFVDQLAHYAHKKGHEVIVVFDGDDPDDSDEFVRQRVRCSYAGRRMSADDRIKQLITSYVRSGTAHDALLISSDRELCSFAHRHQIACMDALPFYTLLQEASQERDVYEVRMSYDSRPAQRRVTESGASLQAQEELDALMESASSVIVYKDYVDDEVQGRSRTGITRSKKEKRMLKIVKKL